MATASSEVRLSREMRLVDITMIGVGAMIGAGIFVLTGIAAGVAGPALDSGLSPQRRCHAVRGGGLCGAGLVVSQRRAAVTCT